MRKSIDKCPACGKSVKCVGKYATVHVYQCTNKTCRRKWNVEAPRIREEEPSKKD